MSDSSIMAPEQEPSGVILILCPYIVKALHRIIDLQAYLEEAKGLAQAIHLR